MATRIFVPLDVAISLVHDHNRTAEFRTNLRAVHLIHMTLPDSGEPGCRLWNGPAPLIRWQVLRSGRPVAEGVHHKPEWYSREALGRFETPQGLYSIDLDFPANCAIGKYGYPRLKVEVDRHSIGVYKVADLLFYTLVAAGIALMLWPAIAEMDELRLQGEIRATYRGMARAGRTLQPLIALTQPLSSLRTFSYLAVMLLATVWWFSVILSPLTPNGLKVYVPKHGTYARAEDELWNEPLVLRIDAQRRLYLNRQPVPRADLEKRLRGALSIRADWTVFLEGDPSLPVGDLIALVDEIEGAFKAKVVLVTPSMAKENPTLSAPPFCVAVPLQAGTLELPGRWRRTRYGEGYYHVSFTLNERGEASNAKLGGSSGIPGIDEWIVRSVEKWKYQPMPNCGKQEVATYIWIDH